MSRFSSQIVLSLVILIYAGCVFGFSSGAREQKVRCGEAEREALLKIKEALVGAQASALSSWGNEDEKKECCNWVGIQCANNSGHVIRLDLSRSTFGNEEIENLYGNISSSLVKLQYLNYLDLSFITLDGVLSVIANLTKLEYLNLSYTNLREEIPTQFSNLSSLQVLDLGNSDLIVKRLDWLSHLSSLRYLDLSRTNLRGVISETHFSNLSKLSYLDLSFNKHLVLNFPFDWIPPFQLSSIFIGGCKIGPQFPKWLQTQKNYSELDISNAEISDSVPNWFWDLPTHLLYLNLSNNQIRGTVANSSPEFVVYPEIDLSSNQFEGPIPVFLFKAASLHLSQNKFSKLDSLCHVVGYTILSFLDTSYNQLSGELPDCWSQVQYLAILILTNNNLSGRIPSSFGSLIVIQSLHLGENNFSGELPSLKSPRLRVLDVGENKLSEPIPTWIGENQSNLVVLILRSNKFYGSMSTSFCYLSSLQLLDLSSNNISGRIPKCLSNLTELREYGSPHTTINIPYLNSASPFEPRPAMPFFDEAQFIWKGNPSRYKSTLGLVKNIDLSNNKLMGEIPEGITELTGLVSLNLSRNNLSGKIPSEMGQLIWLDALDLSNNQISGIIPSSLSRVDRLGVLDLSNNNLSGKIPTSTQLQSFDATTYMGNPELCGAPLANCPGEERDKSGANKESEEEEGQHGFITKGFYVSAALGFVIAFWGVCWSLLLIKSWRYAYFKLLNDVQDWIYVMAAVNKAKLVRMIKS